jgi:thymidylate synthase (FAD)
MESTVKAVEPEVYLIARPALDYDAIAAYLESIGGQAWLEKLDRDELAAPQNLTEFAGRLCYKSWTVGLNPNVTRVRQNQHDHLVNLLEKSHGSVLEHASFSFVMHNVSRVMTHELVRHRVGVAISQESLRFVRFAGELPFWFPEWATQDEELMERSARMLDLMAEHQDWMAEHFGLDDDRVSFAEKKHKTSFMRRFAPQGVTTAVVWTANIRTLRHTIEVRTDPATEEEIRLVFAKVGELLQKEAPALFGDYTVEDGAWIPRWRKV